MRSLKKFLALVLSLVMAAGTVSLAQAARFTDVPKSNETLMKAVDLLSSVGITTGTTDTTFGTSQRVTRQQMATFIYRLMKAGKTVEGKEGDNTTSFTDLDDPFYYFMISWANDMGIIKGRSETSFDPKGGIILQDAYVMITRALGYEKEEALDYPFGYIGVAEDIGLDEGLPSSIKYDSTLTRGNVAILLYNAFYADMATGTTAYEPIFEEVTIAATGETKLVSTGRRPYTIYDTVAEDIFDLKRTVQRVVATPNYCLDSYEKTEIASDGAEMLKVACLNKDYIETDSGLFDEIDFASLKLSGVSDDYFLSDISIYYRDNGSKGLEIISASSLGTYKKQLPGSEVKFEQTTNVAYAFQSNGDGRPATGKVTIDGQVSYLFDAPWSYSKPENLADKDNECITLLWLDKTDRDPEDEEYVPDFNFKSDKDVLGRGAEAYDRAPSLWKKNSEGVYEKINDSMKDSDLRGVGIYTMGGMLGVMQISPFSTNFEADAWDSDSDGKYDYLWLKPYTIGEVCDDEDEPLMSRHKEGLDMISAIYATRQMPTVYTYGANKEGTEFKDGQLFTGYINGPANYIKCATATELEYSTDQKCDMLAGNTISFNGNAVSRVSLPRTYVGLPNVDGTRVDAVTGAIPHWSIINGNNIAIGKTYDILFVNNSIFHVKNGGGNLSRDNSYAMVLPTDGIFAYTTSIGIVTDGNLQKSADVLPLLINGEVENVPVKPQLSSAVAKNSTSPDGSYSLMPVTKKQPNDIYDFSDYVGKLLTYTVNSDGQYVLKIAPLESYNDKKVLQGEDAEAYFAYQLAEDDPKTTAAFVKTSGNLYRFVSKNTANVHPTISPASFLTFTENTKVIIMTLDDDDEPVYTIYDYNNKPNFDNSDDLRNIKYIVKNNPKSKTTEELVYLYAEAADGKTGIKTKSTLDFRFIKSYRTVAGNEGKNNIIYYDVYNPFTGAIEKEYEAISDDGNVNCLIDGIYSVSNGYINDKYNLGAINKLGAAANSGTTIKSEGLGLVAIDDYDTENNFLSVVDDEMLYLVNDKTIITFLDLDEGEISVKSDSILNSTSKNYRCNSNGDMPLLAFVASSKVKNENLYEHAELICIVRYNKLGK